MPLSRGFSRRPDGRGANRATQFSRRKGGRHRFLSVKARRVRLRRGSALARESWHVRSYAFSLLPGHRVVGCRAASQPCRRGKREEVRRGNVGGRPAVPAGTGKPLRSRQENRPATGGRALPSGGQEGASPGRWVPWVLL